MTRKEELLHLRQQVGTQEEVAGLLERSVQWLRHMEQGRRPVPMYALYALRYLVSERASLDEPTAPTGANRL